jgi:hypothetical protein
MVQGTWMRMRAAGVGALKSCLPVPYANLTYLLNGLSQKTKNNI